MAVTTTDFTPRVWPGCLSCYNSGRLVGHWVDCVGADTVTLQAIHEGTGGPFPGCEEITRSRPPIRSAICTAMAPEVVFTFRTKATNRTLPTRLVCQTNRPYPAEQHKLRSITSDRQKWHESDQA